MREGSVALVQPPLAVGTSYHLAEPLGLLLVGAALLEQGNTQVRLIDQALELAEGTLPSGPRLVEAAARQLAALEADTYAFSVQCVDLPVALAIARTLTRLRPATRIVMGGHHVTLVGDQLAQRFPYVHQVARGHGEQHLGMPDGRWLRPAYELAAPFERYAAISSQPTGLVEVARGCPYQCTYCSIPRAFGRRVRHKPVTQIIDELDELAGRGCREVHLVHDTLTLNRPFLDALISALRSRSERLSWTGMTRADLVDPQLLADLASTGCNSLLIGVDAADPQSLQVIDKRGRRYPPLVTLAQWHLDAGIAPKFYFLVNMPGDTPDALERSLHAAAEVSVIDPGSCHVQYPRIVPGTPLAATAGTNLTLDQDSPYAQWLQKTVGPQGEPWDIIRAHPDLFSTYYTTPGPLGRDTAGALAWTASRLLEALPITLAALGEHGGLLDLFRALGETTSGPDWASWPIDSLIEATEQHLAPQPSALREALRFERWLRQGDDKLVSRVDHRSVRAAVIQRRPIGPALLGNRRVYLKQ